MKKKTLARKLKRRIAEIMELVKAESEGGACDDTDAAVERLHAFIDDTLGSSDEEVPADEGDAAWWTATIAFELKGTSAEVAVESLIEQVLDGGGMHPDVFPLMVEVELSDEQEVVDPYVFEIQQNGEYRLVG